MKVAMLCKQLDKYQMSKSMMKKSIKLNNGIIIDLININTLYFEKIQSEFYFKEIQHNDSSRFLIEFSDDIEFDSSSMVKHNGPVASDKFGVFFIDQKNKIARFKLNQRDGGGLIFEVENGFDPHFFYIIILYCASILLQDNNGVFLHAACLRKGSEYILLPAWRHVGKTHLALSLMNLGYDLITDDGIWLDKKGVLHPLSRNIHILYHNMKINPDLEDLIEPSLMRPYHLITEIEKSSLLIKQEHLRYLRSKFRVRVPINKSWEEGELKLTRESKLFLLNRNKNSEDLDRSERANQSEIIKIIYSSSKFELSFMFDLYNVYKSRFGIEIDLFEDYDRNYIEIISAGLDIADNFYKYNFEDFPKVSGLAL